MFSTTSGVAQSFFLPSLDRFVDDTRAMSTGIRRIVASKALMVNMHTVVTDAARSRGVWYRNTKVAAIISRMPMATA
jgi:hypothetical protein